MLKVAESFAGIGAWSKALERLGVDHEVVSAIESDPKVINAYNIIHGTDFLAEDITMGLYPLPEDLDIYFYSPQCQPWSIGNRQKEKGFNNEDGMLFFNAADDIERSKPKFAIMENVATLATEFSNEFDVMLSKLEDLGYSNYSMILNAKDYGSSCMRKRIFVVSIREDIDQGFTPPVTYKGKPFAEKLDLMYDPKYHHSDKGKAYMDATIKGGRTRWDLALHNDTDEEVGHCITANYHKGVPYNVLIDRRGGGTVVRRHTPFEVMRLMGFTDQDTEKLKAHKISDTQIYKMAGNSISVENISAILISLFVDYKDILEGVMD